MQLHYLIKNAKKFSKDSTIVVTVSGRGDKDLQIVRESIEEKNKEGFILKERINDEINMNEKINKINELFDNLSKKEEKALICYIVGGYPDARNIQRNN